MDKELLEQKCLELLKLSKFIVRYSKSYDFFIKFKPSNKIPIQNILKEINFNSWDFKTRNPDMITGKTLYMSQTAYIEVCKWFDDILPKLGHVRPNGDLSDHFLMIYNSIQVIDKQPVFKEMDNILRSKAEHFVVIDDKVSHYMYFLKNGQSR